MSVHYKFKSSLNYDTITFDGIHISVGDLKKSIIQQKKIGKSSDFELQITNAQTKEVYTSDELLIPKNSSVICARIPISGVNKKSWDRNEQLTSSTMNSPGRIDLDRITKSSDLSNSYETEDDKIKAMMSQSTQEYDPSKYVKSRGLVGPLPPNYTCYRCGQPGHYIKHCPTNNMEIKRSTGIPRSFMIPASADQKGALLTASGEYAVPIIDHEAYKEVKKEKPPFAKVDAEEPEPEQEIPEDFQCMICHNLLHDAVLIACCGNSYCDECIRSNLLESENHECPTCHETEVSPDTLIPNRFLRNKVLKFKNETGYSRLKKLETSPKSEETNVIKQDDIPENDKEIKKEEENTTEIKTEEENIQNMAETDFKNDETENRVPPKSPEEKVNGLPDSSPNIEQELSSKDENSNDVPIKDEKHECTSTILSQETDTSSGKKDIYTQDQNLEDQDGDGSNDQQEIENSSTEQPIVTTDQLYALRNRNSQAGPQSLIRPLTSNVPSAPMHRPPILPHPPRGMYHRPGMHPDPRYYMPPIREPHNYMNMSHGPHFYNRPMRPSYPDPMYGYHMAPRPHHGPSQLHRHHMGMQNYSEPPPPGSSPHSHLGMDSVSSQGFSNHPNKDYFNCDDPLEKFAKHLELMQRRSRSRNRSRSRTRSRSQNRDRSKNRGRNKVRSRTRSKNRGRSRSESRGRNRNKVRHRSRSASRSSRNGSRSRRRKSRSKNRERKRRSRSSSREKRRSNSDSKTSSSKHHGKSCKHKTIKKKKNRK